MGIYSLWIGEQFAIKKMVHFWLMFLRDLVPMALFFSTIFLLKMVIKPMAMF